MLNYKKYDLEIATRESIRHLQHIDGFIVETEGFALFNFPKKYSNSKLCGSSQVLF